MANSFLKLVCALLISIVITACDFGTKELDSAKKIRGPKTMAKTQAVFEHYDIDYRIEGKKIHYSSQDQAQVTEALQRAKSSRFVRADRIRDRDEFQKLLKSMDVINNIVNFDSEEYVVMWSERIQQSNNFMRRVEQQLRDVEQEYAQNSAQQTEYRQTQQKSMRKLADKDKEERENRKPLYQQNN